MEVTRHLLIGVAGGSASGTTLIAHQLVQEIASRRVVVLPLDAYYRDLSHLPREERHRFNFDHPDAFDLPLLLDHTKRLLRGESIQVPAYDYVTHGRAAETISVSDHTIVVLEGILVFWFEELRELMNIKIYVDTPDDIRLLRRIRRDMAERGRSLEDVLTQYETRVRPMHQNFVEPTKRFADIIVPQGGHNGIAVEILRAKVRSLLREIDRSAGARRDFETTG